MLNEAFGWLWIVLGFTGGMVMGMRFQNEQWLGGYASHPRRLIRLGHISFFGLGFVNVLFALSASRVHLDPYLLSMASRAFIMGGITMPVCCGLMAWRREFQPVFALPVLSLLTGGCLTVVGLFRS